MFDGGESTLELQEDYVRKDRISYEHSCSFTTAVSIVTRNQIAINFLAYYSLFWGGMKDVSSQQNGRFSEDTRLAIAQICLGPGP